MERKKKVAVLLSLSSLLVGTILFGGTLLGEASLQEGSSSHFVDTATHSDAEIIYDVTSADKSIALTFDDGPDETTESILNVLQEYQVKATFFVVGENCRQRQETVKRVFQSGHEIGNHTYTHLRFRGKTQERVVEEIAKTNQVVYELTGETPKFFRPPGGTINDMIKVAAKRENVKIVLWTAEEDSRDWRNPGVSWIIKNVTEHAKEGSIVLLHDGGGPRRQTLQALPTIISILKKKGYHFVTISELLQKEVKVLRPEELLK